MLPKLEYKNLCSQLNKFGFKNYRDYLLSKHWIDIKRRFFTESKRIVTINGVKVCEICRKNGILNVHHITYKRLGEEYLGDLFLICDDCHNTIHKRALKSIRRVSFNLKKEIWKKSYIGPYSKKCKKCKAFLKVKKVGGFKTYPYPCYNCQK